MSAVVKERRPLTPEEEAAAQELRRIWENRKVKISQIEMAKRCGWKSQGGFAHYLNAEIPLNLDALIKICTQLSLICEKPVSPADIFPSLASALPDAGKTPPIPPLLHYSPDTLQMADVIEQLPSETRRDIKNIIDMVGLLTALGMKVSLEPGENHKTLYKRLEASYKSLLEKNK